MAVNRVLIVEDEAIVAEDISSRLQRMGYIVIGIGTREAAALELAESHRPDVVLMDIRLEGNNSGISAASVIRQRWAIPVVFLTAQAEGATFELAKAADPFGFLLKPVEDRELKIGLEMALFKHQMERALRKSEHRWRVLFEQAAVGVVEIEAVSGRILRLNQRFAEFHGWTVDEVGHRDFYEFSPEEERRPLKEHFEELQAGRTAELTMEKRHLRKDGTSIWVALTISFASSPEDDWQRFIVIVQDITEKKRAEEKVIEQLEELKRWYDVTLNREDRVMRLKTEINELLAKMGEAPRYALCEEEAADGRV